MTTVETVLLIAALLLIVLVIGNVVSPKWQNAGTHRSASSPSATACVSTTLNGVILPLLASCCSMATDP